MLTNKLLHCVGWGFWLVSMAWLLRFFTGVTEGYFYAFPFAMAITASLLSGVAMCAGWVEMEPKGQANAELHNF